MVLSRLTRRYLSAAAISILVGTLFLLQGSRASPPPLWPRNSPQQPLQPDTTPNSLSATSANITKVPLEAHIMSKCPDAKDCLQDLVVPAMEKIADLVDFRLSFIGETDGSDNVHCKHGPTECLGNILALCAQDLYAHQPVISLGFAMCLIHDFAHIPDRALVEQCALEHSVDFDALNRCASSNDGAPSDGLDLLRNSFDRTRAAKVKYSCTVRLNEKIRCIRDSGEWKDCEGGAEVGDLVGDVERLYRALNPEKDQR